MNAHREAIIKGRGEIPVEPFRARFLELRVHGLSAAAVARRLGWRKPDGDPDGPRVNRTLGLTSTQTHVMPQTAERLAEALELSPRDVGL